jgi:hypothetical protein
MDKVVRQHSIDVQTNAIEAGASDCKLAAKIVVGGNARQRLGCAQGIAKKNARERVEFALVQRLLGCSVCLRSLKWTGIDSDALR